jgi:hypothetical protein
VVVPQVVIEVFGANPKAAEGMAAVHDA